MSSELAYATNKIIDDNDKFSMAKSIGFFYVGKYGELIMPDSEVVHSNSIVRVTRNKEGGLNLYYSALAFEYKLCAKVSKNGEFVPLKYTVHCKSEKDYCGPTKWLHYDKDGLPAFPRAKCMLADYSKLQKIGDMPNDTIGVVYVLERGDYYFGNLSSPRHPKAICWVVKNNDNGFVFIDNEDKDNNIVLRVDGNRKAHWMGNASIEARDYCYWIYTDMTTKQPCLPKYGTIISNYECYPESQIIWKTAEGHFFAEEIQ